MPSKDFLYLASSLFRDLFNYIQISMYTISPCYHQPPMIYFIKCKLTYSVSSNDFRNVSVDILIMSALFYGRMQRKRRRNYYEGIFCRPC